MYVSIDNNNGVDNSLNDLFRSPGTLKRKAGMEDLRRAGPSTGQATDTMLGEYMCMFQHSP